MSDPNGLPTAEELQRLREGHIIEQLILVKKFAHMRSETVIFPLLEAVSQGKQEIIEEVAETFVQMQSSVRDFIKAQITNENCFVRWAMVLAVRKIADSAFIEYLIPAIGIGYEPVVQLIVETLNKLSPERFSSHNLDEVLGMLAPREKEAVARYACRQLGSQAFDTTETLFAIHTLVKLQWMKAVIPLMKVTHHHDYRVRQEAQHVIQGMFREKESYDVCIEAIENPEPYHVYNFTLPDSEENYDLSVYAIEALAHVPAKYRKIQRYLWITLRRGNLHQKIFALKALQYLSIQAPNRAELSNELRHEIQGLLRHSDSAMKMVCIEVLGHLGEEWAESVISSYLEDSSSNIRLAVISALSKSSHTNVLEKAAMLLTDSDKNIRRAVVQLFWRVDQQRFFGLNEGDIILKMSEPLRSKLFDRLVEGLRSGSDDYREFAAFWLGVHRYIPAYPELIHNLNHPSISVVIRVIVSLGIYGNQAAISELVPYIYNKNEHISRKAVESIGSLGLDGLHELINQLYQRPTTPEFLENHIMSFGARIINYITQDIERETEPNRKALLQQFCRRVSEKYQVQTSEDFKILL